MTAPDHHRILIVDDNPAIHEDFRKILAPATERSKKLQATESVLFGAAIPAAPVRAFEIDSVLQGDEAVALLRRSIEEGRPYALAFVDVRMPPGLDGVETISRLWEVAPDLQAVICTAYSDYSWHDIAAQLVASHNLVILKKPFDNIEVLQLAHALTHKWLLSRQVDAQLTQLNTLVGERTRELDRANAELRVEIVERRRAEEVLRESEERFRAFMDNSPVIAFMKDEEGRYVYLNKPFEDVFMMKLSDWYGRNDFDAWSWEVASDVRTNDAEVFASETPKQFVESMPVPDGSKDQWLVLKFTMRDQSGQKFIGGVGIDVTERNRLEAQLRQAQKMEAVGQLAGGVAHDFNNILTAIMGYSEMLLRRFEPDEIAHGHAQQIITAASRGASLVRQLLAFSRKQALFPRVVDLNALLGEVEGILRRLIGEQIEIAVVPGLNTGTVKADPGQLEQIIINLAVNSRDAMPDGGRLTVTTRNSDFSAAEAERRGVPDGSYVSLEVSDTGTGMTDEVKAHIFEPFFTTKETGKGTGLGLATCYGIVKQSAGFIEVESELGVGTTFTVHLPRVEQSAEVAPVVFRPYELPRGEETVLVAEDEAAVRDLTVEVLRELGYRVLEARDGEEAQRILLDDTDLTIDLLLTDLGMPRMDGSTLAHWLSSTGRATKVLFASGYMDDERFRRNEFGAQPRLLRKPYTPSDLAVAVREMFDAEPATTTQF
jgi:PAS domain S-box-containing protein